MIHLNEGHPALAALELAAAEIERGVPREEAFEHVRQKFVFTTHTPVAAGNETYAPRGVPARVRRSPRAARARRGGVPRPLPRRARRERPAGDDAARDQDEPPPERGEPAARRGLARRCGGRSFPSRSSRRSPTSRTAPTCRRSSPRRSGGCSSAISATRGSATRTAPRTGKASARSRTPSSGRPAARRARHLVDYLREKCAQDSLLRGEQLEYVRRIEMSLDPDALTIGFARRLATYKRFHLLNYDAGARPPDLRRRPARPARDRRQGASERRARQGRAPAVLRLRARRRRGRRTGRDRRGLRHRDRAPARLRLRPLAQPAAQADGGERHERDEGDVQRRAPAERPRRLVGGGLQRHERLGDPGRRRRGSRDDRRPRRASSSTTCSSTR